MNEITPALVYWITRIEDFKFLGIVVGTIGVFIGTFLFLPMNDDCFDNSEKAVMRKAQKLLLLAGAIGFLLAVFLPTRKEMAAIIVIPRIANSETVSEIGDGVKTLAAEWLEELRLQKKGGKRATPLRNPKTSPLQADTVTQSPRPPARARGVSMTASSVKSSMRPGGTSSPRRADTPCLRSEMSARPRTPPSSWTP